MTVKDEDQSRHLHRPNPTEKGGGGVGSEELIREAAIPGVVNATIIIDDIQTITIGQGMIDHGAHRDDIQTVTVGQGMIDHGAHGNDLVGTLERREAIDQAVRRMNTHSATVMHRVQGRCHRIKMHSWAIPPR